jgi:phosphatidylglycerol---prolipoprotein diacylglyceryl transferase
VHPILFEWGPAGARTILLTYQVAFWSAGLLAVAVGVLTARRMGLDAPRAALLLVCAAVAVPIGARLLYRLEYPSLFTGADALDLLEVSSAHFSLMGGVVLAMVVMMGGARLLHLDLWRSADAIAPGLALGIAVMRTGCFCAGCCFGVVTRGPLGVVFPAGSVPHLMQLGTGAIGLFDAPLPVYPTQLFELAGALVAGGLALTLIARAAPSGVPFLAAAALFTAVRWAVWPLRFYPDVFAGPSWEYPVLYATVIVALIVLMIWRSQAGERAN